MPHCCLDKDGNIVGIHRWSTPDTTELPETDARVVDCRLRALKREVERKYDGDPQGVTEHLEGLYGKRQSTWPRQARNFLSENHKPVRPDDILKEALGVTQADMDAAEKRLRSAAER